MSQDDEEPTPVADAIQAAEALEAAAAKSTRAAAKRGGMSEYHYVGQGPQPGDRSSITVVDAAGVSRTVFGGGNPIALTDEQHAFLQREGHVFEEDIVPTPGG